MSLKECYSGLGGDYEDVVKRLGSEKMAEKFMLKFPQDKNFESLAEALKNKDQETAFRAAHTIKGISQNLGFTALLRSACGVTEALRESDFEEAERLFPLLESDYLRTVSCILEYEP